jgi:hypothetical protein
LDGAIDGDIIRKVDEHLKKQILRHMRKDHVLDGVKSDQLILKFGSAQLNRVGVKGTRRIAASMRLLARLLQCLHNSVDSKNTLSQFLNGIYFDAVIECVEHLSGLHSDEHGQRVFKRPSLPLLVGNALQK